MRNNYLSRDEAILGREAYNLGLELLGLEEQVEFYDKGTMVAAVAAGMGAFSLVLCIPVGFLGVVYCSIKAAKAKRKAQETRTLLNRIFEMPAYKSLESKLMPKRD